MKDDSTVLAFLILVFTLFLCTAHADSPQDTKTLEERLNQLEQKQIDVERQLEMERQRTAYLAEQLAKTQAELDRLMQAQGTIASGAVVLQDNSSGQPDERKQIEQIVDQRLEMRKKNFAVPQWLEKMQIFGDFRYRYEWTDDASKTADRNRNRIQTRIGLTNAVNEEFSYGFRLASGNSEAPLGEGSPTSNNQDLDNAFSSKNIWLDLAYVDYHPAGIGGLNIYAGKIKNPYYMVGNSDLMFDTDITPEGIAGVYSTSVSSTIKVFGTVGGYWLEERQTEADSSLWAVQAGTTWQFGHSDEYLTAGGGYYDFGNVKGREGLGANSSQFYGNKAIGGYYVSDFDIIQGFAEIGVPMGSLPLRVFGDLAHNTGAESGQNNAWLAGASIGKAAQKGTWSFAYNYRDIEADALLGVLTEATFGGGGTDLKGHKYSFSYQLAPNTQIGLSYMDAKRTRSGKTTDYDVVLADFTIKF
ncbi:MAG: putative porin [Phycisphaerae bacterium]|nr:putative porin [Phycisphaerae bacterium]